jgi:phenylacetic acid degradation protein
MRTMREVEALTEPEPGRQRIVFDGPHRPKK